MNPSIVLLWLLLCFLLWDQPGLEAPLQLLLSHKIFLHLSFLVIDFVVDTGLVSSSCVIVNILTIEFQSQWYKLLYVPCFLLCAFCLLPNRLNGLWRCRFCEDLCPWGICHDWTSRLLASGYFGWGALYLFSNLIFPLKLLNLSLPLTKLEWTKWWGPACKLPKQYLIIIQKFLFYFL